MRCLVTGSSGFVGAACCRALLEHGHEVVAVTRQASNQLRLTSISDRIRVVYADLSDLKGLTESCAHVDAVFHLAWHGVTADYRNDPRQLTLNVDSSLQLCEVAKRLGCRHWIGLGSQAEYGPYPVKLREDFATRPVTAYGVAKLATGLLTGKMCEILGIRHTWIRLVAAYGPSDDPRHLIPSVIAAFLNHSTPRLTGGEQICDYLYIDDCVEALCAVLESQATGVFNLSSSEPVSVRRIVELIRDEIDPNRDLRFGDESYRPDQIMHLVAEIGQLRAATGWKPRMTIEEGLLSTIRSYQAAWRRQAHAGL